MRRHLGLMTAVGAMAALAGGHVQPVTSSVTAAQQQAASSQPPAPAEQRAQVGQDMPVPAPRPWSKGWGSRSAGRPPQPTAWKHRPIAKRTKSRKAKAKARRRRMKAA